jgi:hypothetical protein
MVFLEMPIAEAMSSIVIFLNPRLKNNSSDFLTMSSFINKEYKYTTGNFKNNKSFQGFAFF